MRKYSTIAGDMWDYIALKTVGSEKYMSELIEANPAYRDMVVFGGGIKLNIPEIKAAKLTSLPPWRR